MSDMIIEPKPETDIGIDHNGFDIGIDHIDIGIDHIDIGIDHIDIGIDHLDIDHTGARPSRTEESKGAITRSKARELAKNIQTMMMEEDEAAKSYFNVFSTTTRSRPSYES
ncbi:unnamed protein product [Cochlearia groenlandica]